MSLNPGAPSWTPRHDGVQRDKQEEDSRSQRIKALVRLPQFGRYKREKLEEAKKELGQSSPQLKRLRIGTRLLEKWVRDRLGSGDLNLGLNDLLNEPNDKIYAQVIKLIADPNFPPEKVFDRYKLLKSQRRRTMGGTWRKDAKGEKIFVCDGSEMLFTEDGSSAEGDEESERTLEGSGSGSGSDATGGSETYRTGACTSAGDGSQDNCPPTILVSTAAGESSRSKRVSFDMTSIGTQKGQRRGGGGAK
jgi:hypothetical protein